MLQRIADLHRRTPIGRSGSRPNPPIVTRTARTPPHPLEERAPGDVFFITSRGESPTGSSKRFCVCARTTRPGLRCRKALLAEITTRGTSAFAWFPTPTYSSPSSRGKASVVTDEIETFTEDGIRLKSGDLLQTDIIVTATGLKLKCLGGIEVSLDGTPISPAERISYKGMMLRGSRTFPSASDTATRRGR